MTFICRSGHSIQYLAKIFIIDPTCTPRLMGDEVLVGMTFLFIVGHFIQFIAKSLIPNPPMGVRAWDTIIFFYADIDISFNP